MYTTFKSIVCDGYEKPFLEIGSGTTGFVKLLVAPKNLLSHPLNLHCMVSYIFVMFGTQCRRDLTFGQRHLVHVVVLLEKFCMSCLSATKSASER